MQTYKLTYKNVKVTSISSRISKEWKALSDAEKSKWKKIAEQDKLRYENEKKLYKGPWKVKSERPRKDPSAPKRPPSAFLNYSRTRRAALIREYPNLKNTDISKLLGQEWKVAPPEVRQPHVDREATEREDYHKKISAWREQQRQNKEMAAAEQQQKQQSIYIAEQKISSKKVPFDQSLSVKKFASSTPVSTAPLPGLATSSIWGNPSSPTTESMPKGMIPVAAKKLGYNNDYDEQYSTVSPSPIHVVQRTVYQPILPYVSSLLPHPPPAQGRIVSHQDLNTIRSFSLPRPFEQLTKQMQLSQSELSSMSLPQPPPAQGKTVPRQDINAIQTFPLPHPFEQVVALNAKKVPNQIQLSSMTTGILDPPVGTPVTPLTDTTPSSVTTDYQNLFFPMTFEEEEDSNVDPPLLDVCSTEGLKIDPFIH